MAGRIELREKLPREKDFNFDSHPEIVRPLANIMVTLTPRDTELFVVLDTDVGQISANLSKRTEIPTFTVLSDDLENKKKALKKLVRGRNVCLVQSVVRGGEDVIAVVQKLRKLGAKVEYVICAVDATVDNGKRLGEENIWLGRAFKKEEIDKFSCLP